jgi:hypothetical protein
MIVLTKEQYIKTVLTLMRDCKKSLIICKEVVHVLTKGEKVCWVRLTAQGGVTITYIFLDRNGTLIEEVCSEKDCSYVFIIEPDV